MKHLNSDLCCTPGVYSFSLIGFFPRGFYRQGFNEARREDSNIFLFLISDSTIKLLRICIDGKGPLHRVFRSGTVSSELQSNIFTSNLKGRVPQPSKVLALKFKGKNPSTKQSLGLKFKGRIPQQSKALELKSKGKNPYTEQSLESKRKTVLNLKFPNIVITIKRQESFN